MPDLGVHRYVGFGLTFVPSITVRVMVIGAVTFGMSFAGGHLGDRYHRVAAGDVQPR
jgi:hypothetical protein